MTTASKPFTRAFANRLWYHFMGRGIGIAPDLVNGDERSDHQELIVALAEKLTANRFQLKPMIRLICSSETYQRAIPSESNDWPLLPTTKPLSPDQLYDSLHQAIRLTDKLPRAQFTQRLSAELTSPLLNSGAIRKRLALS